MTHDHHAHGQHLHEVTPRASTDLPLSLMAASAATRVGVALLGVAGLWLAILWAVAKP